MRALAYSLADLVGLLACVLRLRRRVALENLRRAGFTGASAAQILRRAYQNFARSLVDLFFPPDIDDAALSAAEQLRGQGGLLVLTGHLGAFDALACAVARRALPLNIVSRHLRNEFFDRVWWSRRALAGVRIHDAVGSGRTLFARLRRGEIVALVLDQHTPPPVGIPVVFFGEPAFTSVGLARLSRAARVPVLPAFLVRGGRGLELKTLPPIQPRSDVFSMTLLYNQALEDVIRTYPDQWFWWHRRWKRIGI